MRLVPIILGLAISASAAAVARADNLVVFAAASLTEALNDAAAICAPKSGVTPKISYASSLALARQIEQGAPADLFVSADLDSMDYAQTHGLIRPETRANVLSNDLVVIAPKSAAIDTLALTPDGFAKAIGASRLATGDIASVPVGKYAKAALEKLGAWTIVEPRLAQTDNVRSALAFVARGEAALGIVYSTDAAAEPGVKVVATFPADSHPPIVYPFAVTAASKVAATTDFLRCLESPAAAPAFKSRGFGMIAP